MWNPFKKTSSTETEVRQEPQGFDPRQAISEPIDPMTSGPAMRVDTMEASVDNEMPPIEEAHEPVMSASPDPESGLAPLEESWDNKPTKKVRLEPEPDVEEVPPKKAGWGLARFFNRQEDALADEMPENPRAQARRVMRQRLVGLALILLTVVLLTSFFLDDEKEVKNVVMERELPPVPMATDTQRDVQVPTDTTTPVARPSESADLKNDPVAAALAEVAKREEAERAKQAKLEAEKKALQAKKEEEARQKAEALEAGKVLKGAYYVQIMATGDEKKAKAMVARFKKSGIPAYYELVNSKNKNGPWRIRAGGFADLEDANSAISQILLNNLAPGIDHLKATKY